MTDTETDRALAPFSPPAPTCFVSPHLDDVVISCAGFLSQHPGAIVATVFAGSPEGPASRWDRAATGCEQAIDAVDVRRQEDLAALASLHASAVWLPLTDGFYGETHDHDEIVDAIGSALADLRPASVVAPLGIQHPDHVAVSDACLSLVGGGDAEWYMYEEGSYALEWPDLAQDRRRQVADQMDGAMVPLAPFEASDPRVKTRTVGHYASQVPLIQRYKSTFDEAMRVPERFWRLSP